eukprot:gene22822-25367_t
MTTISETIVRNVSLHPPPPELKMDAIVGENVAHKQDMQVLRDDNATLKQEVQALTDKVALLAEAAAA